MVEYENYLLLLNEKGLEYFFDNESLNKYLVMKVNEIGYLKFGEKYVK